MAPKGENRKLDSWKSIAEYLGRDVRSVQRWERERGLPVHRVPGEKGGTVFAYSVELEAWLNGGQANEKPGPSSPSPTIENGNAHTILAIADRPENGSTDAASVRAATPPNGALTIPASRRALGAKRLAIGITLAALFAVGGYLARDLLRSRMNPQGPRIMLGVLPFVDLTGDPEQEYLSDGFTEEIISQLGNLNPSRLGVIARTSAMTYKHTTKSVDRIGRELGVDYLVEGSVRRFNTRVRVTAQLVRTSDQTHLWAESFDRDVGDILKLEEDVSHSIAQAIQIQLKPSEPQSPAAHPVNAEAYEDYLKARYYGNQRTGAAIHKSIEYYSQAVSKDPNYAQAYAGLADAYLLLGLFSVRTIDVMPKAESAAAKALELDATLADAHTSMAGVKALYDWDWRGAEREFKLALDLNPDDAQTHHAYAVFYCVPLGRKQETIEHMERALKLDPLSPVIATDLGWAYFLDGQTNRAIEEYRKALELDLRSVSALDRLAQAYEQQGRYQEMLAFNDANAQFNVDIAVAMRRGFRQAGYRGALKAESETMEKRVRGGAVYDPYSFASIYAKLGETDRALEHLEKALEERNPGMVYMNVDPPFQPLRGNAKFQNLERRVGLIP